MIPPRGSITPGIGFVGRGSRINSVVAAAIVLGATTIEPRALEGPELCAEAVTEVVAMLYDIGRLEGTVLRDPGGECSE